MANTKLTILHSDRGSVFSVFSEEELKEMTDYECILLAGIPNAPSVYAPTKNPELAIQRQKQVMNKMVEYEYLTQEEANKILEQNGY